MPMPLRHDRERGERHRRSIKSEGSNSVYLLTDAGAQIDQIAAVISSRGFSVVKRVSAGEHQAFGGD